ncbi:MAG TPA: hypothetical protein VEK39_01300 [Solirubrobacterales bacterium]|nr:hypothetical protein [Solirubrobacterales bacterium]
MDDDALDSYRRRAERFCEELAREHYLQAAGHKRELEIEAIYARHGELFAGDAIERLRELVGRAGDAGRRLAYLLEFAVHGHIGLATVAEQARLAELEAELELELDGERIPYRAAPVEQANQPDAARRAAISQARDVMLVERLNPLHLEVLESAHELARSLGWKSYREMCAELRGIDLEALAAQTREFVRATESPYPRLIEPELERAGLPPLGELRRSDLPRLFRAPALDELFPDDRVVDSFAATLSGLGIDLAAQSNVHFDVESRPTKSARAFCATPRIPTEVYLVIAPVGGRDDYATLFHEGGHAEHYANADPDLAFEYRHLGDNSVTESFAFLLEGLTSRPEWLEARLGVEDAAPVADHVRVARLVMLRRYAAKLDYELELHGARRDLAAMPGRYAELLGAATRVDWPQASWLSDVDSAFYAACYLRAWALEALWRRALGERFGERWFEQAAAGEWLRALWARGQRLRADELLAEALGEELDFTALAAEFGPAG